MLVEPHPINGMEYADLGDGIVKVTDHKSGRWGKFRYDGIWLEGELNHADPHFLLFIGGPKLPPEMDIFYAMAPLPLDSNAAQAGYGIQPTESDDAPQVERSVLMYVGDPGIETERGMRSSAYVDMQYILENDRRPELIPNVFRLENPMHGGPAKIPTDRFHEQRIHDLEVERIWNKAWQMVCRVEDIPEVGDYHVYDIAHLSWIVVRSGENEFSAHQNVCLHRGRALCDRHGKGAREFRCPYHGWSWKLDGSIKEVTTEWDFPGVREDAAQLPAAKVATWGGFIFINPDPDCEPLEQFLGPVMLEHYRKYRFEDRYKQAHVQRVIKANWKVVMEAFMEGYHVIGTHPQIMVVGGGDSADIRYDVFGNWGRAQHISAGSASPQRGRYITKEEALAQFQASADFNREFLRGIIGDEVEEFSDVEISDQAFCDVFPNFHPWAGWARIVFRFRPNGSDPDSCIMDAMLLAPWPKDKPRPAPVPVRYLGPDDSWCDAPELAMLARIIDQDCLNLPRVQAGLKMKQPPYIWYSAYQEGKIRHFHENWEKWIGMND
jgi:phenylpropionate dioxygenase-like ring-hydroxylating dioxygenase large terminal subunit